MATCNPKGKYGTHSESHLLSILPFRFSKPGLFLQIGALDDPLCFRNFRDFVFMVRPRLRYEAFKEYNAFKIKHEATQA